MSALAYGVWHDLRERRLAPVAIGLVLALLVIPLLLHKPAEEAASTEAVPVPAAGPSPTPERSLVRVDDLRKASELDTFSSRDPFKPLKKIQNLRDPGSAEATGAAAAASAGSSDQSSVSAGDVLSGTTEGGSGGGTTDGGSGTTEGGAPETQPEAEKTFYTYTVDVAVTANGREKVHKDVERLSLLPSEEAPLFVFLGASTSGKTALFLVDDTLTQSGEGQCKPDGESCTFLYLQADPEKDSHSFEDPDGEKYGLRVLGIEQKQVDPAATNAVTTSLRPIGAFLFPLVDGQSR